MDIRTAYDWGRIIDWLDSDITAYTIKNAVAFVIVWWLARGWLRPAPVAVRVCVDRGGADHLLQCCRDRIGRSANCDAAVVADDMQAA